MLIGELSKRTGLSRDTIRFYEKEGLICVPQKQRRGNNYKEYPESIVDRLGMIRSIQELGFTIREIDTFFELWQEEDATCKTLVYTLENKLVQIESQIERLNQLKSRLTGSLQKCRNEQCEFEKAVPDCIKKC
jgi:DNA-binding transcriptional MerR regulator